MTNRTFLFFLVKRPLFRRWAQGLFDGSTVFSLFCYWFNEERKRDWSLHTRDETILWHLLCHTLTSYFLAYFSSSLLPNLFFSSSLSLFPSLFHNFIGHVLDSVNSVMSLVDYRLYDVMVRVGFQRKDEGCLGCTSGPPSKLGSITSFGKEMYTLPNNRGTMEAKRQQRWHRQYCAAADTDTIQLYSIQHAKLGATYWTIKIKIKLLEATSWVGRFMFRLYYYHIKQITYNQRSWVP